MRQLLIHDNNNNKNNNRGGGDNNNNASAEGATGGHNTTAEGEYFLDLRQLQPNPTPEGMGYNMLLHYTVALSRDGRGQGGIQSECECKASARHRLCAKVAKRPCAQKWRNVRGEEPTGPDIVAPPLQQVDEGWPKLVAF